MRGAEPVCAGDRLVLRAVDADGDGGLTAAKNGKIYGKGMNVVRSISRRFGRATGCGHAPLRVAVSMLLYQ